MGDPMHPENMARLTSGEFPFLIPLPTVNDGLEATARKMQAIANIISAGGRLELTFWPQSIISKYNAEARAKEGMNEVELAAFNKWQYEDFAAPEFDWTSTNPTPAETLQSLEARAAAMDVIWGHKEPTATSGNAAWLSSKMQHMLPLVKAIEKVTRARKHIIDNYPFKGLDADQITEIETLRFINLAANLSAKRDRTWLGNVNQSISQSQAVLKERVAILETQDSIEHS
jgi:hypothetical protein